MTVYVVCFFAGFLLSGIPLVFCTRNMMMYRELWENERVGNHIMTERLTALEIEREQF